MSFGHFVGVVAAATGPEVQFTDITWSARVNFKHENSATSNKYLLETMGGGVTLLDHDNEGRLAIFFTNGAKIDDPMPDGKLPDKSDRRFWNRPYHQNTDGTFTDVTEKAGLTGMAQNYYTMGVAVGDYDNDGFEDTYLTGCGGNTLYRNNGDGTFTDVTKRAGVSAGRWSASAGFFVTRYVNWSFRNNRYCGEQKPGLRAYCHPDNFRGVTNILYHNNGDGTFTDVSAEADIANPKAKDWAYLSPTMTATVSPTSLLPTIRCRVSCTTTMEMARLPKSACPQALPTMMDGKALAAMGIDFSDFDNDVRRILWSRIFPTNAITSTATSASGMRPTRLAWAA